MITKENMFSSLDDLGHIAGEGSVYVELFFHLIKLTRPKLKNQDCIVNVYALIGDC